MLLDRRPVVIGIRDPEHYPLAIGWEATKYRVWNRGQERWSDAVARSHFVVHMGHQQEHPDMVPYDSWFQGALSLGAHRADDSVAKAKPTEDPVTEASNDPPTQKLPTPKHKPIPKPTGPVGPAPTPKW